MAQAGVSEEKTNGVSMGRPIPSFESEACAYTDGASGGSRGPGGYAAIVTWKGKTKEISGGEPDTTNQRMELTAGTREALLQTTGRALDAVSRRDAVGWFGHWGYDVTHHSL